MAEVQTPTFAFSGLYYPQIYQDLVVDRRGSLTELNDEDPNEPSIQLLRAFALVGHYNNVLLDHVALESLLPTARLRTSVKAHLKLIGVDVNEDIPATADMLLTLSAPLTADYTVPALATFATQPEEGSSEIQFEVLESFVIAASEELTAVIEKDGSTYTDRTATLTASGSGTLSLWGGTSAAGDMLYFGHEDVLFDRLDLLTTVIGSSALWDAENIVLEVWDGRIDTHNPDGIGYVSGITNRFTLTTLLGSVNRAGVTVTIRSNITGAKTTVVSTFVSGANVIDLEDGLLGAGADTYVSADYTVGVEWREVASFTVSTDSLTKSTRWTLPESTTREWNRASFEDATGITDFDLGDIYWARLRCVQGGNSTPTLDHLNIQAGTQYIKVSATQGKTVTDSLGTSDGSGTQSFISLRPDVIDDSFSSVTVDDGGGAETWTQVRNFLSSLASDTHFTVDYDEDGYGILTFGDGVNGKIPAVNAEIAATYRVNASDDGNVAANTIVVNRGTSKIASAVNPRAASGWQIAEGSTAEDLERLKVAGPATLRAMNRAVSASDLETLALDWEAASGASPFIRVKVIEGANGPKTVEIVTVESGTGATPQELRDEFETYLNGDSLLAIDGMMILNMTASVTRYTPKTINVVVTTKGGDADLIELSLRDLLRPDKTEEDGSWTYEFGGQVYRNRVVAEVFRADPAVSNVSVLTLNGSAADVTLGARELPVYGTISVAVT